MPDKDKIREIHDHLQAIVPLPEAGEVSALALARHLAVSAMRRSILLVARGGDYDPRGVEAMCAEFAAATAMYSLAATSVGLGSTELELGLPAAIPAVLRDMKPAEAATFIRDCWDDGGSIGEFLWEYLGEETCAEVKGLVDELVAANAEAKAAEAVTSDAG